MNKAIDVELVRHIGRLSRIELTDDEIRTFSTQLAAILDYFGKLQQLDTEHVEPMAHAVGTHNVLAADEVGASLPVQRALANAPQRDGNLFKVPKVIGDS